jgi:hypothetical protein
MRVKAAYALLTMAAVAAALAMWAFFTGGFRVYVYGIALSARGEHRAALVALVLGLAGFLLLDTDRHFSRRILRAADTRLRAVSHLLRGLSGMLAPGVAVLAAATTLAGGLWFASYSAGGSDPYGYVSQAALWLKGDLRVHQDFVATVPWPNADWTFSPLGYKPSTNHTLVPTYAPGLPLLMALSQLMLGSCGPYLVGPICGAVLIWLTYVLGVRLSGPAVGAMAALCVASSPTMIVMALSIMSDVPTTTFWTASLLLAGSRRVIGVAGSGAAAGIAILIRPNLAPLAVFPLAIALWQSRRAGLRPAALRTVAFALCCAPFVLFIGWVHTELYGSPLQSGYGDATSIYSWKHLRPNLNLYPVWLWETQGPFVFLFLLAPFVSARRPGSGVIVRALYVAFVATLLACYLFYLPFDAWWYLRFLLPAFPIIFILAADAVWNGVARFGSRATRMAAVLFTLIVVYHGARYAYDADIVRIGRGEQKYADTGRYVARQLPSNAVLFAMQHSGNIRLYSGRLTIRYDSLDADWLDRAIAYLRKQGYDPHLVLEDWEVPLFRKQFATQKAVAVLDGAPLARTLHHGVVVYRTDVTLPADRPPDPIPATTGCDDATRR